MLRFLVLVLVEADPERAFQTFYVFYTEDDVIKFDVVLVQIIKDTSLV